VAKANQGIRVATRSLPKHLAGRFAERMERIKEDPTLLLPECRHTGSCPRAGLERKLRRVQRAGDDRGRLRRLSRRGGHFVRAYAGALDLNFGDGQGLLVGMKNPFGGAEVKFAQRGNARKESQAGIQNYTDKGSRLMAWIQFTHGIRGVYVFSTEEKLICTGRRPVPPVEFLTEVAGAMRPALVREGADFVCPHLKGRREKPPREAVETHLAAKWKESDNAFRICAACAGDGRLAAELRKFALGPQVGHQVEAWGELRPKCRETGAASCHFDERVEFTEDELSAYQEGKTTDGQALDAALSRELAAIDGREGGFVLAAGVCMGNDVEALVSELDPDAETGRAIQAAFEGERRDVVLDTLSASKLLAKFMDERGEAILEAACGNAAVARRVLKDAKPHEAPATLIQRAVKLARDAAVETALPSMGKMTEEAAFADRVARAFRRGGADAALREIENGRGASPSSGAIAWSLLLALDKAGGRDWQFSKIEIERGTNAKKAGRKLLDCSAEDYAKALGEALEAGGVHDAFELKTT